MQRLDNKKSGMKAKTLEAIKAEHLLTFCQVAELSSVSEAAKALGQSQPAVSRQLASLQRGARQSLYERTAHGVRLTQAGRDLLPYACAVARTLLRARDYLQGDVGEGPVTLRLGLSHHLITRYTGPLLKAAKQYNQDVHALELHLTEGYSEPLGNQVLSGHLDAALVLGEAHELPPTLTSHRLSEDHICLLVLPDDPIAEQAYVPLSIVEGETLILSSSVSRVFRKVQDDLLHAQVKPGRVLEVSGPAAVRTAVLAGQGVGVTLRSFVAPEVGAGWLKQVALENSGFTVGIWSVAKPPTQLEETVHRALDALLDAVAGDSVS